MAVAVPPDQRRPYFSIHSFLSSPRRPNNNDCGRDRSGGAGPGALGALEGYSDGLNAKWFGVPGQQADQKPEHSIGRGAVRDGGEQDWLRVAKGTQCSLTRRERKGARAGRREGDANLRVTVAGVDKGERLLAANLPGADLLPLDPPAQSAQKL